MRLICPNNPNHITFYGHATVTQDWLLDQRGEFLDESESCLDVVRYPQVGDDFACAECREIAESSDDRS